MSFAIYSNMNASLLDLSIVQRTLWQFICAERMYRDRWEKLFVFSTSRTFVDGTFDATIPKSERLPGVVYLSGIPAYKERVMVRIKGSLLLMCCHLGGLPMLCDIIVDSLVKNGANAVRSRNDIMIGDGKAIAVLTLSRAELFVETAIINVWYNDALFKSLLPKKFYRDGYGENETGITGVMDECPGISINSIIANIFEEVVLIHPAIEKEDIGVVFPYATTSKDEYKLMLGRQLKELKVRGTAMVKVMGEEINNMSLKYIYGGAND